MATERKCRICGGIGHDARNCPMKDSNDPRNKIVWFKIANLTDRQADRMTNAVIGAKRRIAPEADAAYAKGDKKSLPERILHMLKLGKGDD